MSDTCFTLEQAIDKIGRYVRLMAHSNSVPYLPVGLIGYVDALRAGRVGYDVGVSWCGVDGTRGDMLTYFDRLDYETLLEEVEELGEENDA